MQGQLSLGDLFSFTLFLGFLIAPILQMANIGTQMTDPGQLGFGVNVAVTLTATRDE